MVGEGLPSTEFREFRTESHGRPAPIDANFAAGRTIPEDQLAAPLSIIC